VRRDPAANQPAEETAGPISGVGGKPLWLQIEAPLSAIEHRLGRLNLVVHARRRWLNVDNDRVLDVDEIIEPVAELHPLVGLGSPRGTGIARRYHLRWLAIRIGLGHRFERREIFLNRAGLALRLGPLDLIWRLAMVTAGIGLHHAGIDGKAFTLDQSGRHAGRNDTLEYVPKHIARSKPVQPVLRERRV
jgi:hypothetical protein